MRVGAWVKKEFLRGIVIFLFFFITLSIITLTEELLINAAGGIQFSIFEVLIATALITKIILVLDHLAIAEFLPARPVIFRICWKTLAYWTVTVAIRQLIRFASYFKQSGWHWEAGWKMYLNALNINLIIAVYVWYIMLLALFLTAKELTSIIGANRMRAIFFGTKDRSG